MNKKFPIQNNTACQYKWAWSSLYLNTGTTASCHRCKHYEFNEDTIKNFHNLPGKIEDRKKMLEGVWPGNGCEYCKEIEAAGGASDRTAFVNGSTDILPVELETDPTALTVTPSILEVYFSNLCNQSCIYCRPKFSSIIEHEVIKHGNSNYNHDYNDLTINDVGNYKVYREKFFEYMEEHGSNLVEFKVLGGEPFYQEEFEMCLDFFDKHPCPKLNWHIFSNLNHKPDNFKAKLDKVKKLIENKKIKSMMVVCSIDCWGPALEYVRYGLRSDWAEKNILALTECPGVDMQIHATITALSMPSMYILAEKVNEWKKIKNISFHWNTVHSPSCFDIYHFGDKFLPDVDRLISVLKEGGMQHYQDTIYGIRAKMESKQINKTEISKLYQFLNELDVRRNEDWKNRFKDVSKIMSDIIHEGVIVCTQ